MPNTGANGPGPAGNGSSNSREPGAIRYELFVGNRTSSFDERQSACDPGNLPLRLRGAALRIHGRCNRLRATQNIHRRVSARRRRLLCRSGALVICAPACAIRHPDSTEIRSRVRARACRSFADSLPFNVVTIQRIALSSEPRWLRNVVRIIRNKPRRFHDDHAPCTLLEEAVIAREARSHFH